MGTFIKINKEGQAMGIRYEWQVAEQVQPAAQRHTDVPGWMTIWDGWSTRTLESLELAEEQAEAERAAYREQALRAPVRRSPPLAGLGTPATMVTTDSGSAGPTDGPNPEGAHQ